MGGRQCVKQRTNVIEQDFDIIVTDIGMSEIMFM